MTHRRWVVRSDLRSWRGANATASVTSQRRVFLYPGFVCTQLTLPPSWPKTRSNDGS